MGFGFSRTKISTWFGGQTKYWLDQYNFFQENSIFIDNIYNKISSDVAMMEMRHIKHYLNEDMQELTDFLETSPLQEVLTFSPNLYQTPICFWTLVVRKMIEYNYCVVLPVYHNEKITEIHIAHTIIEQDSKWITFTYGNDKEKKVRREHLWIFENPRKNLSNQLNGITQLINDNLQQLSYQLNANPATLRGLLKLPTTANDVNMKNKAKDRIENLMSVASSTNSQIGYLLKDEEFQELKNTYGTASDSQVQFLMQQLYNSWGLNQDLFTCNYNEQQQRAYTQSILTPLRLTITQELNRKNFTKTARTQGHRIETFYNLFDSVSLKDQTDFVYRMRYMGVYSINDGKRQFNMNPVPGGDLVETNTNQVPILNAENEVGTNEVENDALAEEGMKVE
jgi:hypothetical protein